MINFDVWNLQPKTFEKAVQLFNEANISYDKVVKASMAAAVICRWVEAVIAMGQFDPTEFGG